MTDLHRLSISELSSGLEAGTFSSLELTEAFLKRITDLDPGLNAVISVTAEQARVEARAADAARAAGQAGPLAGIPIVHKDIFCTDGVRTSCGSKMLDQFIAPYDAEVVALGKQAGLVMLGKANMDEFAMGSSNETSFYGAVRNPWDTDTVPGGSSGGSAASVAARLTPWATGTDTGGSIRQPAALCGITGLKPTYGRVSRWGMIAFASSLDQAGPMAPSALDCAHLLGVMAKFDPKDSTSIERDSEIYTDHIDRPLDGLRIGLPGEYFGEGLDPEVGAFVEAAIATLEAQGATIKQVSLPNSHLAVPAYYVIAPAECSSNLSRFDGSRFGHRADNPADLEDMYKRSREEGFGAEVKRRIMVGTYALSAGYYDAYYLQAQKVRQLIQQDFRAAFEQVDLLMGPTSPSPAFRIGERSDDPISMYLSDIYTIAANLAGLPAMSVPAGFTAAGLPVGLQMIGNYFDEQRLLNAGHRYQCETDWHTRIPQAFA